MKRKTRISKVALAGVAVLCREPVLPSACGLEGAVRREAGGESSIRGSVTGPADLEKSWYLLLPRLP